MNLYVLDRSLEPICLLDEYESLVWTSRAHEHSSVDMQLDMDALAYITDGYALMRDDCDEAMLISGWQLMQDSGKLTVKGIGSTSAYEKRLNWGTRNWTNATRERVICDLFAAAVASVPTTAAPIPSMPALPPSASALNRAIPGYLPLDYSGLGGVLGDPITTQVTWQSCYKRANRILDGLPARIGCRYVVREDVRYVQPYLALSVDHSDEVVLQFEIGDLIDARVERDMTDFANYALVGGQGEGTARVLAGVDERGTRGGELAEMWVDADDLEVPAGGGYTTMLTQRGREKLAEVPVTASIEADCTEQRYHYRSDFVLGDRIGYQIGSLLGSDEVAEVRETFESAAERIEITLGKAAPTVRDLIEQAKGA